MPQKSGLHGCLMIRLKDRYILSIYAGSCKHWPQKMDIRGATVIFFTVWQSTIKSIHEENYFEEWLPISAPFRSKNSTLSI